MKRAVVLEIKDEYAAVLTDEGLVQKIPDENYTVGQEIVLPDVDRRRRAGLYRAAGAAAIIVLVSGSLHYASENAFAYSTVTVSTEDTSLELTLNRKDEVVAVKALDEKSQAAAENLDVSFMRHRPLAEMLKELTGEDGQADVRVGSRNKEHRQDLEKRVKKTLPLEGLENAGVPGADGQKQESPAEEELQVHSDGDCQKQDDLDLPGGLEIPEIQQKPDMSEMIRGRGTPEGQGQTTPGGVQIPSGEQNAARGGPSADPGAGPDMF